MNVPTLKIAPVRCPSVYFVFVKDAIFVYFKSIPNGSSQVIGPAEKAIQVWLEASDWWISYRENGGLFSVTVYFICKRM